MQFASLYFDKLYGKNSMESTHLRSLIRNVMKKVYEEYALKLSSSSQSDDGIERNSENVSALFDLTNDDGYERMKFLYSEMVVETANEEAASELDMYLLEKLLPLTINSLELDYDVLSWWKHNTPKFSILAEPARDVLAVQVSSVASKCAFSTSGRILDTFCSCLTPYMIEVLVCSQQWLRNSIHAEKLANLVQMFEELDFHDSFES